MKYGLSFQNVAVLPRTRYGYRNSGVGVLFIYCKGSNFPAIYKNTNLLANLTFSKIIAKRKGNQTLGRRCGLCRFTQIICGHTDTNCN